MSAAPLVSICIPCFNAEPYLREAIDSALGQTYPNVEVIVVDDGSTDGSVRILQEYANRLPTPRFRFEAGPNRGGCVARNRALELSKGEFINFLDADDELHPEKIARQLPLMLADQSDCVLCKVGLIWPPPRPRAPEKKPHPFPAQDPLSYFFEYPIQTAAPLHRRRFLENVGGFRPGLPRGQEADLHLRLAAAGVRLGMIEELLIFVRMHDGARVSNRPPDLRFNLISLLDLDRILVSNGGDTPARRLLLGERLFRAAQSYLRDHSQKLGILALRRALELNPGKSVPSGRIRGLLYPLFGVVATETLLLGIRRSMQTAS